MKKPLLNLATATMFAVLAACGSTGSTVDDSEFNQALSEAKALQKKAVEVNHAWTTTDKALEDAEEARTAGDMDKALKLVKKAKGLAELSYQQYETEKNAAMVMPE